MKILAHLSNTVLFLAAWIAAFMALHWLMLQYLEVRDFPPGQDLPLSFRVAVEVREQDGKTSYESRRYTRPAEFHLLPNESLHLSTRSYEQTDFDRSCCIAFQVLEDGANGQLIELNDDDFGEDITRYRLRDGKVIPISNRAHFSLYYLLYLFGGALLAWLLTRPLRRRVLAWAKARTGAATG